MSPPRTRADHLTELADNIRELTQPRTHTETREVTHTQNHKRWRAREKHTITMPSLLQSLTDALTPGNTGEPTGATSFESRPSADLEPLRVWTLIRDQTNTWNTTLGMRQHTLHARLTGLVSAHHTDQQLDQLTWDTANWVRQAKIATGWDPASFTLGDRCPGCMRKHCLVVSGDLETATCDRCKMQWQHDTIHLLGRILEDNRTQETLTTTRCPATNTTDACYLTTHHTGEHRGPTGRYWHTQAAS
jgi:hypothetical protein